MNLGVGTTIQICLTSAILIATSVVLTMWIVWVIFLFFFVFFKVCEHQHFSVNFLQVFLKFSLMIMSAMPPTIESMWTNNTYVSWQESRTSVRPVFFTVKENSSIFFFLWFLETNNVFLFFLAIICKFHLF
jgi:hypothetical protein